MKEEEEINEVKHIPTQSLFECYANLALELAYTLNNFCAMNWPLLGGKTLHLCLIALYNK